MGDTRWVRQQYHFWPGTTGIDAWDVSRLIRLSAGLPVIDVPVESISEIDTAYWFDETHRPTVRAVLEHARLFAEVDLRWPILLGYDGRVMDGMHRIGRAILDGLPTVRAVRFDGPIEPDFRHCRPEDLVSDD